MDIKLDLGCGEDKREGCLGVDIVETEQTDIVHDLEDYPWPIEEGEVEEIYCDNLVEHIEDVVNFMEEICRVGEEGCNIHIWVPYWNSEAAFRDPTHEHYFTENSFNYFTEEGDYNFYSGARVEILETNLIWHDLRLVNILRVFLPDVLIKRHVPNVVREIHFELKVVK